MQITNRRNALTLCALHVVAFEGELKQNKQLETKRLVFREVHNGHSWS